MRFPSQPGVRIELDREIVPRGENLSGTVCFEAGSKELWLDRVTLVVSGVAKTVGSPHNSFTLPLIQNASVPAGETRRFPLWVPIPADTDLGPKLMMAAVADWPTLSASVWFEVEPERHYVDLGEELASATGLRLQAWAVGSGGEGVYAQLQPGRDGNLPFGPVGVGMRRLGEHIEGELVVDVPCSSVVAVIRSLVRPERRRIPFSVSAQSPESAALELAALLQSCIRNDRQLPLPASAAEVRLGEMPLPAREGPE